MLDPLKNYLPVFKIRICSLITLSAVVGLISASSFGIPLKNTIFLVLFTMMSSAGASAFNHYFDTDIDSVMKRTRKRPLPSGAIAQPKVVLLAAGALFAASILLSSQVLNFWVAVHLFLGGFVYAVVYTVWLKRRSRVNIIIGGLAGSFAVLAGGASAMPELCLPPVLLAVMMFFWTPSHFWSFAIVHKDEYRKAGVPMLPAVIGDRRTAKYILANTLILVASSLLPPLFGYFGVIYTLLAAFLGLYFIAWNVELIRNLTKEVAWKNFKASMVYLGGIFLAVIIDAALR